MRRISNTDASFFYADTQRTPSVVGGLMIYDQSTAGRGKVRFKEILSWIEDRLHLWAPFTQRLVRVPFDLDLPYLAEDPNFDVEFHVRHLSLPKPGDWRQLCILASRLYSRPLDMNRPLWEVNVIEGLDKVEGLPKGSFAVLVKLHHMVVDGMGTVSLLQALHSETKVAAPPRAPLQESKTAKPLPSDMAMITKSLPSLARQPLTTAQSALSLVRGELKARRLKSENNVASAPSAPMTRFNKEVTPYRVFEAVDFKLDDFRSIKKLVEGASVNDVAIAVCGGAMRRYLAETNELPGDSLVAMCPISVRTGPAGMEAGNQITDMTVAMGTDIADPLQRLQAVKMRTDDAKQLAQTRGSDMLESVMGLVSPATASWFFRSAEGMKWISRIKPVCNTFVSNVPGIPYDMYFSGAKLVRSYGLAPLGDGMGIFHAITGYQDQLSVCVTADREMLPDPDFYARCVQASFDEYKALVEDDDGEDQTVVYLE
eukprot:s1_g987.t1